jgi:hypothetical protein
MVVRRDFIEAHLDLQGSYDETVVVGMRHRVPYRCWSRSATRDLESWGNDILPDPRLGTVGKPQWSRFPWAFFSTCNASIARKALLDAGLFDEAFTGWGFEDTELGYRLQIIGMQFRPLLEPVPYHLESEEWDMTEAESLYHLPADKMAAFRRNAAHFAGKYPDDRLLQRLLKREGTLRMLASKSIEYVDEDGGRAERVRDASKPASPAAAEDAGPHVLEPQLVPRHLSLLTPYDEGDERVEEVGGPDEETVSRMSLLDELHHDFGIVGVGRARRAVVRVSDWVWTVALTPVIALSCLGVLTALVVTGRYRRMFRRDRS